MGSATGDSPGHDRKSPQAATVRTVRNPSASRSILMPGPRLGAILALAVVGSLLALVCGDVQLAIGLGAGAGLIVAALRRAALRLRSQS